MGREWGLLKGEIVLFTYRVYSDKLAKMNIRPFLGEFLWLKKFHYVQNK